MQMSRLFRIIFAAAAVAGLGCGIVLLASVCWEQMHMVYPSPANESVFLKSYSPADVVRAFESKGFSSGLGWGSSAGAGREFTTHTSDFDGQFTMRSADKSRLMFEVKDNLERQLIASNAQILSESGDSVEGFRFTYRAGSIAGSVAISPLRPAIIQRGMPLSDGLEDVRLTVSAREKWFAAGLAGTRLASFR